MTQKLHLVHILVDKVKGCPKRHYGMRVSRFRPILTVAVIVCVATVAVLSLVAPTFALSEGGSSQVRNEKNTNGFFPADDAWFEEGTARTVFAPELKKAESPDVGFYKERSEPQEEELREVALTAHKGERQDFRGASEDQILATFGEPEKDAPLTAVENAPAPFQAMMAAMDAGQEELAYRYARQYVRHIKNLKNRSRSVSEFTSLALEREGAVPSSANKDNPYRYLLEKDLSNEESPEELAKAAGGVEDPKVAALIDRAASAEATAAGAIPVDPNGEVDVLFFFSVGQEVSMSAARAVQSLQENLASSGAFSVRAYSLEPVSSGALEAFKATTRFGLPIQEGQTLARRIGVRSSPTVVFVARNTGEMYRMEEGLDLSGMMRVKKIMAGETHE